MPESKHLPDSSTTPERWLRVARLVRPQGHRGELIAELLTDFPERFATQPLVWLRKTELTEPSRQVTVDHTRLHSGRIVFTFAECTSMNEAELLRGWEVVVPWEQRAALSENEVYIAELTGCALTDTATGALVGTVVDVDRDSSHHPLLVVQTEGGEVLVPFVKAYEPSWDVGAGTLRMRLPAGLLDLSTAGREPEEE